MKTILKQALHRFLPKLAGELHAIRDRQQIQRFERQMGLARINQEFVERHGLSVMSGPFCGMKYVPHAVGSAYVPKLLGSYEAELHGVINSMIQKGCDTVVDVGCAEGYYAVGFARCLRQARVFAFDTASEGRRLCAALAEANNVAERVTVAGACDHHRLNALLTQGSALVICDCEGYEYILLKPGAVSNLCNAHVLVELHPWADLAASPSFLQNFAATHDIQVLTSRERHPEDYPALAFLPPEQQQVSLNEWRPKGQQWAFLSPQSA